MRFTAACDLAFRLPRPPPADPRDPALSASCTFRRRSGRPGGFIFFNPTPPRRERFTTPSPLASSPRTTRTERNVPPARELGRIRHTKAPAPPGAAQLLRLQFSCWHVPSVRVRHRRQRHGRTPLAGNRHP